MKPQQCSPVPRLSYSSYLENVANPLWLLLMWVVFAGYTHIHHARCQLAAILLYQWGVLALDITSVFGVSLTYNRTKIILNAPQLSLNLWWEIGQQVALCTCLPCLTHCSASCTLLLLYRMWMRRLVTAPSIQHLHLMLRLMLPCSKRPWRGWVSQNYTFPLGGYIGWGGHYIGTVEPPRTRVKEL